MKVCHLLKRKIAESERVERQRSGKDAIRRVIRDFLGTREANVSVFELEVYLLDRLRKEAEFIGQDASKLSSLLSAMLERVRNLRAAKQDRLVGETWDEWRGYIDGISKNPLSPDVTLTPEEDGGENTSGGDGKGGQNVKASAGEACGVVTQAEPDAPTVGKVAEENQNGR